MDSWWPAAEGHIRHDHQRARMLAELRGSARGQDATQDALGSFQQLIKPNQLQLRFETLVEVAERMRHFHAAVAGAQRLHKALVKLIVRLQRVATGPPCPRSRSARC